MVDLGKLRSLQAEAKSLAEALGLVVKELSDTELKRFGRAFERQFVLQYTERQIVDLYLRHQGEALLGAMVAKEQMDAEIDGEQPGSGKIGGPLPIRACWLGIGDDWEDILGIYGGAQGYWSTGSPQNWIHSGTTLMGGTAGNPVKIGENAVHVIFGIGSLHASPKIESVKFEINGKEKPTILTFWQQKMPFSLRVKELDNAFVWKKGDTILGKVFISGAFGDAVTQVVDYPYLIGVSFIKEPQLRLHDPSEIPGTVQNIILTV